MKRARPLLAVLIAVVAMLACAAHVPLLDVMRTRPVVAGDLVLATTNAAGRPRAEVGGLSGAYYDSATNRLYAVADDRQRPRVIVFDVSLTPKVILATRQVVPLETPQPTRTLDAEGIAPAPNDRWFVSSEGDPRGETHPVAGIHEYTREGKFVRSFPLPPAYLTTDGNTRSGMRLNLSFEALGASPDGRWLFAALESSLLQDGPAANFDRGAVVRLLAYDLRHPAKAPREYAYITDAMPKPEDWTPSDGDAGVVDVLPLGPSDLLVLERGYIVEDPTPTSRRANRIRIYGIHLERGAEITGRLSLAERPPGSILRKRLVLDLATVAPSLTERLRRLENFEAIAFGPRLPDGSRSVLLLSDDNFSPNQVTALVALRWPQGRRP